MPYWPSQAWFPRCMRIFESTIKFEPHINLLSSSNREPRPAFPGGRSLIEQAYKLKNMSPETIKISIASLSSSSLRQYNSALKKWWTFCHLTEISVFSATNSDVLQFLSKEFEQGAAYGSINLSRSAVALILGPQIGEDVSVKRFCRGTAKLRPAQRKYDSTWDPKIVLDHISQWSPNQ